MSFKRLIFCTAAVALFACGRVARAAEFHFTVTADPRGQHAAFGSTLQAINDLVGGPGAFHVSPGDIDGTIPENRAVIDAYFGPGALWYPGAGNHETETPADMAWLRNEYHNGNGLRTPLKEFTNQDGPSSSRETTYTWDYGNAHFIVLDNQSFLLDLIIIAPHRRHFSCKIGMNFNICQHQLVLAKHDASF